MKNTTWKKEPCLPGCGSEEKPEKETGVRRDRTFRKARADEADTVFALYQAVIGMPFCVWNDEYPGRTEIRHDLETGNLFVLEQEKKIIGAISLVPENELDDLDCWSSDRSVAEFARVVLLPEEQGNHLAQLLVSGILEEMRSRGYENVHISVAKENLPAQKTYRRMGFDFVGEEEMWGHRFFLCEKKLTDPGKSLIRI